MGADNAWADLWNMLIRPEPPSFPRIPVPFEYGAAQPTNVDNPVLLLCDEILGNLLGSLMIPKHSFSV